jgi:hypothetical protein
MRFKLFGGGNLPHITVIIFFSVRKMHLAAFWGGGMF